MALYLLHPGERVMIGFHDSDGEIEVRFNEDSLEVVTEWADTTGRVGVIYREEFSHPCDDVDGAIIDNPMAPPDPGPAHVLKLSANAVSIPLRDGKAVDEVRTPPDFKDIADQLFDMLSLASDMLGREGDYAMCNMRDRVAELLERVECEVKDK